MNNLHSVHHKYHLRLENLLSDQELLKWSIIPKADITVQTHFACKRLEVLLDQILSEDCGAVDCNPWGFEV